MRIAFGTALLILSTSSIISLSSALEECLYPELGFEDSCYYFAANIALNWPNAEASCRKWGGDIVAVDTEAENDFIVDIMLNNYTTPKFWIGLSSFEVFEWSTLEENQLVTQFDPSPFPVHCVYSEASYGTVGTRGWLNEKCHTEMAFVCERAYKEPSTTPVYTTPVHSSITSTTPRATTNRPPRPPIGVTLPADITAGANTTWVTSVYDPNFATDSTYIPATGYPPQASTDANGNPISPVEDPTDTSVAGSCAQIWSARLGSEFDGAVSYSSLADRIHPTCIIKPRNSIMFAEREEARKWCATKTAGHLVAIQSVDKFNFINGNPYGNTQNRPIIGSYNGLFDYWIGLQHREQYMWNNGALNTDLSYAPIAGGTGKKSCYYAGNDNGKWREDLNCISGSVEFPQPIGFLCETTACPSGFRSELYFDHIFQTEIFGCFEYDACAEPGTCGPGNAGQCIPSNVTETGTVYTCNCSAGYENSGGNARGECVDINECETIGDSICGGLGVCINIDGSHTCGCTPGTTFNELTGTCIDGDECSENPDICLDGACTNVVGGYTCDCNGGFEFIHGQCHDVNECFETPNLCGSGSLECVNVDGFELSLGAPNGYKCICNVGYEFNDIMCMDINECMLFNNYCSDTLATCVNEIGFSACTCPLTDMYELVYDYGTKMCGPPNLRSAYLASLSGKMVRRKRKAERSILDSYNEPSDLRFMRVLLTKF